MALTIGDRAPNFKLTSDTSEQVTLASFRGKRVVIYFYPKDDTPGCTAQARNFRDQFAEFRNQDAVVIGISPQDTKSHQKFKTKYQLPFILLSDPDHAVAEKYGAWGEKSLHGKKYMGIVHSHFVIDEKGKIVDVQYKVTPKDSAKLALQVLKEK
ncbi:MAG: thioredoxin-dependent thiol peroxidase [Chloroflexi bacterium]|nr:thioredoxin-dependent thiol peroxidase [Chloroflexota bacterium]